MLIGGHEFSEVVVLDFEYGAPAGERPTPVCLVAHLLVSGRVVRLWKDELATRPAPPFPTDKNTLIAGYYMAGDLACFKALGWSCPERIIDVFAEFRNMTNGRALPSGAGLIGALTWFGEDSMAAVEKDEMRSLVLRGGPWSPTEQQQILDYCEMDVVGCTKVLRQLADPIDTPRALLRGRYTWAVAGMEWTGIPIDTGMLALISEKWESIKLDLIREMDAPYGVYDNGTFREERFAAYLARQNIPWPLLPSGRLDLDRDAFTEGARLFPQLGGLKELRASLSALRLNELAVGRDGRNRCMLSPFGAKSGRNSPSSSRFIFGPAKWIRRLIRPEPGRALAYLDYAQQEFAVAGVLSDDANMVRAYDSGDPYLEFARMAGAVPPGATKATHGAERSRYKTAALGVQYGQGAHGLAARLGIGVAEAEALLANHRRTFPSFWKWSDAVVDYAMLVGELKSPFGWTIHAGPDANPRTFRNFMMQASGADILRIACILMEEAGITVCAPVHDAVLIEANAHDIDSAVATAKRAMERASAIVLGGFALKTEDQIVRPGERFQEERGEAMWATVNRLVKGCA